MPTKAQTYSLHPSFAHWSAMLGSLAKRTGRDIHQWETALNRVDSTAERRAFLKSQNLKAATVGLILDHAAGKSPENYAPQAMVDQLFKGPKAALLPLYETVLEFALQLGGDVKACPCKTMVPLYRNHVFAQLRPATGSRLDLGLALGDLSSDIAHSSILIDTGGLARKDRITHRLELSHPSDFNAFVKDCLRQAYAYDKS